MGKIYSMAKRVVVWLGEVDSAQTKRVEQTVQRITNYIRRIREEGGFGENDLGGYEALRIPDDYINTTTREILRRLYANPWFFWIWCVQEIVLAENDAIMLWGEHALSWADVGMIAAWLYAIVTLGALEYDPDAFDEDIEAGNAYRMYRFQRMPLNLLQLLDECWGFKASNLRDRVYGLLTLVEPKEQAQAMCFDYDKSIGEVYADTVIAWIRLYKNLTPLSHVDHGSVYDRICEPFTSWTPKWHAYRVLMPIPYNDSPLSACKDILVKSVDASKIIFRHFCLKGIYYSEFTSVCGMMDLDNMQDYKTHPFLDIYHAIVGQINWSMVEIPPKSFVLARTLTAGCNSAMKDITNASMEEQNTFYNDFLSLVDHFEARVNYIALQKELPHQDTFYDEAHTVSLNRRIFHTKTGNFGLGPGSMREVDIIAVLFGGKLPYVLRPYGESYLFIGQVYVDNLIQGELADAMEAGTRDEEEFCLV